MGGQAGHVGFPQHSPLLEEELDAHVPTLDVNDEVEAGEKLEILIRKWIVNFQKFTFGIRNLRVIVDNLNLVD